jgi:hypothetical protein
VRPYRYKVGKLIVQVASSGVIQFTGGKKQRQQNHGQICPAAMPPLIVDTDAELILV